MYMKQIKRGTVHEVKIITHNFVCRKNNLPLVLLKKKNDYTKWIMPHSIKRKNRRLAK